MTLNRTITLCCLAAGSLLSGCAAKEGPQSLIIRHAQLTLMEAAVIAQKNVPESHAIKVELTHANGAVFYEVEVLKKVLVDAENGRILPSDTANPMSGK